jgi:sugar (pentulose or hexulose) kinase
VIARESREAVVGIDLGTTMSKALLRTPTGEQLALVEASTPWTTTPDGGTETSAERFVELAADLLRRGYARASIGAPLRVSAVAVAGLAESGVLLDGSGRPRTPVVAWFDRRGSKQIDSISLRNNGFGPEFVRRTGLPWDSQASVAKLLWFVDGGLELTPAHRWLSMPEYVVHRLGGQLVREPSLASRTGLLDQATGSPWADGAVELGLPPTLLPTHQPHGESVGTLRHAGLPEGLQGAALLVGGHDHPVAAIGVGATGPDELFNSTGTADVVVRSLPGALTDEQREHLVGQGISVGMHVLPDTSALIGGVRGGLLLRRVLGLLGVTTAAQRDALDRAALTVGSLPAGLDVSGAGPTRDDVVLRVRDDVDPAAVWAAATRYTARETRMLLDLICFVAGPHSRAVASGGWTRMASVRAAKSAVIDHLTFSELSEPVAAGAALLAQRIATTSPV